MKKYVFIIKDDVCAANGKDVNATELLQKMKLWGDVVDYDKETAVLRAEYQASIDNLAAQLNAVKAQELTPDEIAMVAAYRENKAVIGEKYQVRIDALEGQLEEIKVENDEGNARKTQERIIARLQKQMNDFRDQEDKQYELLETGKYTQELFDRRNAQLRAKMEECEKQLYNARSVLPKSVNYAERVVALEAAITALHDPEASTIEVNKVLKAIIDRIEFTGEPGRGKYGPREGEGIKLEVFLKL